MTRASILKIFSGPVAALLICFVLPPMSSTDPVVSRMAAVAVWVAIWWLTEAVHLSVTALLPFFLLPLLGIMDAKTTAFQYMDQVIFLFIGGFIIAFAIERWELHRRLALKILSVVGARPSSILWGVMLTSFLISMWISNTATVMMLISAVLAVITQTDRYSGDKRDKVATALLLGLAYSASIGGLATLVGTPTNMIFFSFYQSHYPADTTINFARWMLMGFPLAFMLLVCTYFVLRKMFLGNDRKVTLDTTLFRQQYRELGKMKYEEKVITGVFTITALLWFFRADIDIGTFTIPGWSNLLSNPSYIQDSTVAVFMAFILFFIPSRSEQGRALMVWEDTKKLPFGIILLFGSGFALAKGFEVSGLSTWLAGQLNFMKGLPVPAIVLGVCVFVCLLSEFASNVASIQLFLPIVAAMAQAMNISPLLLILPATFAASSGFMLPVATAPNTIVFGTNRIRAGSMMRAGFLTDIFAVLLTVMVTVTAYAMGWL
jgi:solute carrier family 13 (sodium-dependent dicarboxylate transporter), member 2/3/5